MKTPAFLLTLCLLSAAVCVAEPALQFPEEQAAWTAIAARFTEAPTIKEDKTRIEYAVRNLRQSAPPGGGTASVAAAKVDGHVTDVVANAANFNDEEFKLFAAFSGLHNFALFHNSGFTGAGLAHVTKLPKLERITLAGGSLADVGMVELAKIATLRELRVFHSQFTDAGVAAFRAHPSLESIWIGPQWSSRQTDKSLESLATCPKLKKLTIDQTWLTWEGGLRHLAARSTPLVELDLQNCIIEPAEVERFKTASPSTKVIWKGFASGAEELRKPWLKSTVEKWIPKEILDRVQAEDARQPPAVSKPL